MKTYQRIFLAFLVAGIGFAQTRVTPYTSDNTPVAWTSATAAGCPGAGCLSLPTNNFAAALVTLNQTTTLTNGGTVTFEGSDTPDTSVTDNWFSVPCAAPTTNTSTYTFQANTNVGLLCNTVAWKRFRARLSNVIGGSGTVNLRIRFSSLGDVPGNTSITNLPAALDTNSGAAGPSTLRTVPATGQPLGSVAVTSGGLITKAYLGSGSANTAKTTGAITVAASTAGHNAVAILSSGNFATSNWSAAVTDSGGNTWVPIGPTTGTLPQANSTTQVSIAFVALNITSFTTITGTISGSSSANTTVAIMAWDVGNAIPSLAAVDQWSYGTSSGATAIGAGITYPSHAGEVLIAGGCASTGTISLPSQSGLTFDSGSIAIASGSNCVTLFGGSAILDSPTGVTGSFTDGSSAAYSEVVVLLKGYSPVADGLQHLGGITTDTQGGNNPPQLGVKLQTGFNPAVTSQPLGWMINSNPGSNVTASATKTAVVGRIPVVTGFCYSMVGDGTGAASTQTLTLATGSGYTAFSENVSNAAGVSAVGSHTCLSGFAVAAKAGDSWVLAFGGHNADALQAVNMWGYDVLATSITY